MADMQININMGGAGGVGGAGGAGGPSPSERADFQNQIKDKPPEELANKLAEGNLKPWEKQEIMKEFMNQLMDQIKNGDSNPQEKKDLEQLLKDLKNSGAGGANGAGGGNGAGGAQGEDLLAKMLEALGIPPDVAQSLAKAISGGGQQEEGAEEPEDIQ